MTFAVGAAKITRIEETYGATYPLRKIFPECTDDLVALHREWLAPHHYDADSGLIKLSVHSWLLEIGGRKILIDSCCGNNKVKPDRPFWNMLNVPWLDRLQGTRHGTRGRPPWRFTNWPRPGFAFRVPWSTITSPRDSTTARSTTEIRRTNMP